MLLQPTSGLQLRGEGKTSMCLEYLETGTCAMGVTCPFAHSPNELQGYNSFQSGLGANVTLVAGARQD